MSKAEEFLLIAEREMTSGEISEIEVTAKSARIRRPCNPSASDYRAYLTELAYFLGSNSHIGEIEIGHPTLGRIRLSRQENDRKGKADDNKDIHPKD